MTVEQIDSSKVLISLCNEDLTEYSLRFDTMSFNDPHSRRILNKLLTIACGKTGIKQEKDKSMLVEAMPHSNGCLILLTMNHKKKKRTVYRIKKNFLPHSKQSTTSMQKPESRPQTTRANLQ